MLFFRCATSTGEVTITITYLWVGKLAGLLTIILNGSARYRVRLMKVVAGILHQRHLLVLVGILVLADRSRFRCLKLRVRIIVRKLVNFQKTQDLYSDSIY